MTFIFDFDGTLCDDFRECLAVINELSQSMGFKSVDKKDHARLRTLDTRQLLKELEIPFYRVPQITIQARKALAELIETLKPVVGINEALRELVAQGVTLGGVTSNDPKTVEAFLRKHNFPRFSFFVAGSSLFGKKKKIKTAFGLIPPGTCGGPIYVGDELRDVVAARACGIDSVAVTWGFQAPEVLKASGATWCIENPAELVSRVLHEILELRRR